jgi:deoxyribonucleoside regulator
MNNSDSKPWVGNARKGRRKTAITGGRSTLFNEEDALAKVTWLYYHRKLTQQQIAEELGISRPTVIRLLRQASESGLVTVSLRLDILRRMDIAQEMAQRFGLKEVFIVPTSKRDTESDVIRAVGRTGALYLETNIKPHQILTISWGRMMYEVASALTEKPVSGLVVAQSFGG